ncbi:hypothetical protein RvY_08249 [Ramazzottius varieornatus]|uniref:Uncharacterized protein n=1 Tax=Ramazzottius varieornatus TaxID=947166 RepID=A0A1D1V7X2_RAMVA|nr:hypothetical protein RvY_08249 [Ramazzottius varieornatus]
MSYISTDSGQSAIVELEIEGTPAFALLDSGSTVTCVSLDLIKQLSLLPLLQRDEHIKIVGATLHTMITEGHINLKISAYNRSTWCRAHVLQLMPQKYDYILSWPDFLKLTGTNSPVLVPSDQLPNQQMVEKDNATFVSCIRSPTYPAINVTKHHTDQLALFKETQLKVGDQVLLFSPARSRGVGSKLHHYWSGPCDILQQTGPNNFRVSYNRPGSNTSTVVNTARLKRYVKRNGSDKDLKDFEEPDFDELHPIEFKVIESSDDEAVPANDRPILATQVSRNATTAKLNEQHDADEDDYITSVAMTVEPPHPRTNPATRPNTLQLLITIARCSKFTTDETLPKSSMDNPRVRTPPRRLNIASKAMPPPLRIPDPRPVTPQAATTQEATPRPRLETLEDPPILRKYRSVFNLANPPDSEREDSPSQSGQGTQPQTTSVVKAVKVLRTKKQRGNRLLSGLSADNILKSDGELQDQTQSAARVRRSTPTYTTCEKLAAEPKPQHVNYSIYAMKKDEDEDGSNSLFQERKDDQVSGSDYRENSSLSTCNVGLRIRGGGLGKSPRQLLYVKDVDWGMRLKNQEQRPKPNDVLLEASGYNFAGVCTYFMYAVMEQFWKENAASEFTVIDGAYFNGNSDLVQFMQDNAFPAGSFKEGLQLRVRRAIYQQFPPTTSRLPTADEVKETYPFARYIFWSKRDVAERVERLRFLERGEYEGNNLTSPNLVLPILTRVT